jgi:hypothetical protein
MAATLRSLPGICDVAYVRGAAADPTAPPDLLFEVAHGATLARHFDGLRGELQGSYGDGLRDFFFVNTDVGAPELAHAVAARVVKNQPRRTALVVRCLLPRTFVDCNRRIDRDSGPQVHRPGQMTPGMPPWVQDARDQRLLLDRYFAYRDVVTAAFAAVRPDGFTLFVHTYAPRSIDVTVDADIGARLREAYAPDRVGSWPLRPAVDLITHDPDGRELAAPELARRAVAEFTAAGFEVARNSTYALHPITLAHGFAAERPLGTLCLEVRRDLLLREFVPFVELLPEAERVERAAAPLAAAIGSQLA